MYLLGVYEYNNRLIYVHLYAKIKGNQNVYGGLMHMTFTIIFLLVLLGGGIALYLIYQYSELKPVMFIIYAIAVAVLLICTLFEVDAIRVQEKKDDLKAWENQMQESPEDWDKSERDRYDNFMDWLEKQN